MGTVVAFARPTAAEAPKPVERPNPRHTYTKDEYWRTTPDSEIALDLLAAISRLNDGDSYAARDLADNVRVAGKLTDGQRSFAISLIWKSGRQTNMARCECCQGKGFLPAKQLG